MTHWREHQEKDPYFQKAKAEGYRARSAYKLLQIQEKFRILRPGAVVVDLGAAPGSWSQVAARIVGPKGRVVAIDIQEMEPIPGSSSSREI
jgi:23S rRNA (uridine2552-2'-O)-methyltransferase